MPTQTLKTALALFALALALAACGDDPGLDRSNAQAVFRATMRALHDSDLPALDGLLTKEARLSLDRDLRRLQARLKEPKAGDATHDVARARLGERYAEEVRRAVEGNLAAALRFYMLISPREREPAARGLKQADAHSLSLLYETGEGVLRPVRLVNVRGAWYVEDVQL